MTDNEIIKALPKILYGGHGCIKCEYAVKKGDDRCGLKGCRIAQDALDLINRQQVEIERLKEVKSALENDVCNNNMNLSHLEAEIKRLQSMNQAKLDMIHDIRAELETAKSEAIREFADTIKIAIKTRFSAEIENQNPHLYLIDTLISDLVKERVGEENA